MKRLIFSLLSIILVATAALSVTSCSCSSTSASYNNVSSAKATEPDYTDENGIGYVIQEDGTLKVSSNKSEKANVEIPEKYDGKPVTALGRGTFKMSKAKSVTLPKGITSIDDYAFAFSSSLENVNIPEGVKSIGTNAFSGCSNLKSVELPSTLEKIDIFAFDAAKIETITIPKSVTSIGEYAFAECESLTDVIFEGKNTVVAENAFNKSSNVKIIAPEKSDAITLAKNMGIPFETK